MAAGGGKWAAPWLVTVDLPVTMLHAPYVRGFEGFGRPWSHLEPLIEDVHIREVALGSGYIVTGQAPRTRYWRETRSRADWLPGSFRVPCLRGPAVSGWYAQCAAAARRCRPAGLQQRAGEQARRVDACPVTGVHVVD